MHPDKMSAVIDGKRYSTETATLLASDEVWDGSNWERHGRNAFLYRTAKGAFFTVTLTQWQGERDTLTPVTVTEAKETFEAMPKQLMPWAEAFGVAPEEA